MSDFWLGELTLKNTEHLKKDKRRWWNFCISDDDKKDIEPIFIEKYF